MNGSQGVSFQTGGKCKKHRIGLPHTICKAFDKQLDALYGEEALDISTDITVLENMLAQEGLGGMTMESGK